MVTHVYWTRSARNDLFEIYTFIELRNPEAARRIGTEIEAVIELARQFPRSGRKQKSRGVRRLLTRHYKYAVTYRFDKANDEIIVLLIEHPKRNRKHQNE